MIQPTAVILAVGLTRSLIGAASPNIARFAQRGRVRRLRPSLPAVTCTAQADMLTGQRPCRHGVVANGWYNRELAEVQFWKQNNRLVQGEKVWDVARRRDPSFTCANLFWWFNMYSGADYSVTPRPIYKADGRKIPDIYTHPSELRDRLQGKLGTFPLFSFWGPGASIQSTKWIADAAIEVHRQHDPTLSLVYLPHLDYALQKFGPDDPRIAAEVTELDRVAGSLLDYYERAGVRVILLSEYGIEPVSQAVPINRVLREDGALRVRTEQGLELLDAGASDAFAVVDHQVAHVYVKDADQVGRFQDLCARVSGVERVLNRPDQHSLGINHRRSGDLVLVAESAYWFSYPYWLDDRCAPDFARTVDIHRKPGYDPLELFIDPTITAPRLKIAWKLLRRRLGQRTLLDVIPLDTSLVRGSHGRVDQPPDAAPVLITHQHRPGPADDLPDELPSRAVHNVILDHLFDGA